LWRTKAEDEFRLTPDQLRSAITPRTKALVLPFPCNPTGGIMDREDLEAIAQVLRGTEIMVVSDEIYAELTYGQHQVSLANLPDMYERTLVVIRLFQEPRHDRAQWATSAPRSHRPSRCSSSTSLASCRSHHQPVRRH
jgi:hypothetical protein